MICMTESQLELVKNILNTHVPDCEVRAFGSRYLWTAKDYSDLDLVVVGNEKLDKKTFYALKEAFEDSDLPFRVDLLDWNEVSAEFRAVIERGYEILQI
jgi:predicted nucleotidyltransferase